MSKTFQKESCTDFNDFDKKCKTLLQKAGDKGVWIFRGQQSAKWKLETNFERACARFGVVGSKRVKLEYNMIREFQRRLHQYMANEPDSDKYDEWMALMQHHGAPTRLLDFTYSPYVAAYFAFEKADLDSEVAIWAVNTRFLEEQLGNRYKDLAEEYKAYREKRQEAEHFNSIFPVGKRKKRYRLVLAINPFRLNERLAYQRGVFLCTGHITVRFMKNLSDFIGNEKLDEKVIQYTIPTGRNNQNTKEALNHLDLMNINRITLFPGLDGFAQSFSPRIPSLFEHQG